jgi:glutathione peroxidase
MTCIASGREGTAMTSLYDFTVNALDGRPMPLREFAGKVVLVVNTASKCGFTPQYSGLERLYTQYEPRGFVVLGFPCNQFGQQEPGNAVEIGEFCLKNYGVSFPMFEKIDVNGPNTNAVYTYLKNEAPGLLGTRGIKWNFTKFLLNRSGEVTARYAPLTKPESLAGTIEKLL